MSYPSFEADSLPVVRYVPGPRRAGASHAVGPERLAFAGRFGDTAPLLLTCLMAASPLLRPPLPVPLPPVPPSAPRVVGTLRHAPVMAAPRPAPWDARLDTSPPPGRFLRFFRMRATAYTPINTRLEGGRYTLTQRDGRAAHGVAVDPDLIPLGSRLWIPGYGHAVADDIGGAIQGHHVDIRVQVFAHMNRWGVRQVRVYVLQEPKH